MLRLPDNTNLSLHWLPEYMGFPVQVTRGPLVENYLQRLKQVLDLSLSDYGRVFAFRFDLRFPLGMAVGVNEDMCIERFIASFKAKIRHNRNQAQLRNRQAHDTLVRYVWCREIGQHGLPHFHFVMFLNGDAFSSLGKFEFERSNIFNRLHEAWGSALKLRETEVKGLVEFPSDARYLLRRDDPGSWDAFFCRSSYLCKVATKAYGDGRHNFGSSRG